MRINIWVMAAKYVLLVEDNDDDVTLTRVAFQKCRIENRLEVVNDGKAALDFLSGREIMPAAILRIYQP